MAGFYYTYLTYTILIYIILFYPILTYTILWFQVGTILPPFCLQIGSRLKIVNIRPVFIDSELLFFFCMNGSLISVRFDIIVHFPMPDNHHSAIEFYEIFLIHKALQILFICSDHSRYLLRVIDKSIVVCRH